MRTSRPASGLPVRALAAALLLAAALTSVPAAAAATAVCNRYCDGRDPALSGGDRTPVEATVYARRIVLHFDDTDAMAWGSIDNGNPGDEVWLDRSFDGGRTWSQGGELGDTTIPSGRRGWRTLMYNVDDWNTRGVGAMRACGKAGDRAEIACTPWARTTWNAWSRSTAAATALMMYYDNGTGRWNTTGWWNSANALTAIIDNIRVSGMDSYRYAIATTYDANRSAQGGNFRNDYLDDTAWWGLAWVDAYDLTGDTRYLDTARADADWMTANSDGACGGGVYWRTRRDYKNAITNELYLRLTAALHNRIPGDTAYLALAKKEWSWFAASGMINSAHLINDGLDLSTCRNNGQPVYTYNQGVVLGGLAELYRATGDTGLLDQARRLADASTTDPTLNPGGVLADPGEPQSDGGADGPSFKGAYVRGLAALNAALADHPYTAYLTRQADTAHTHDRDTLDRYGYHWAGPLDSADAARQQSALDLMNAAG